MSSAVSPSLQPAPSRKANTWLIMTLLFLIFFGPMLFAWNMYRTASPENFRHTNHGELILPPIDISTISLFDYEQNKTIPGAQLLESWWLMYVLPKECDEGCLDNIHNMRQIHVSLGREQYRLHRMVLFLSHEKGLKMKNELQKAYPDLQLFSVSPETFDQYLPNTVISASRDTLGEFFILDPLGNMMMHHEGDEPPKGILADIKKLIRLSQIG